MKTFSLWRECWSIWLGIAIGAVLAKCIWGTPWNKEIPEALSVMIWIAVVVWLKRDRLLS